MAKLINFSVDDYGRLIASDKLDATKGALYGVTGLAPDTTNRTILIGLGGTGVKTIDYVKGVISKRLTSDWQQYIAFLGIDTDWEELNKAAYLDQGEKLITTVSGISNRMSRADTFPAGTRRFMIPGAKLGNLEAPGAGKVRLAGKVKVHDQAPGQIGVDQKIINKLAAIKATGFAPLMGNGRYEVYIIGSSFGGTCSGALLEMPSLIRTAIPSNVQVKVMLYLPDTFDSVAPDEQQAHYANGYATLKELDYFMGMYMRPGYKETWTSNDQANPEIKMESSIVEEGFIDIPYLVGTLAGGAVSTFDESKETIAEFLISVLGKITTANNAAFLTASFDSNARNSVAIQQRLFQPGNPEQEAVGAHHNAPRRYAGIGFAKASFPRQVVRAYTVGKVSDMAGLRPVSQEERASREASGGAYMVPFAAKDDYVNATAGTGAAKELLAPIINLNSWLNSAQFDIITDLGQTEVTWRRIKKNEFDTPDLAAMTKYEIDKRTSPMNLDGMRNKIKAAFGEYRINVREYVKKNGPYAFVNLYEGRFTKVGEDHGIGVGKMLQNLMEGKLYNGVAVQFPTVEAAQNGLNSVRSALNGTSDALIFDKKLKELAIQWKDAYNNLQRAKINATFKQVFLGINGEFRKIFVDPAAKLTEEVGSFGALLEALAGTYANLGSGMEDYNDFLDARDNLTEINMAAVDTASWKWLKQQADNAIQVANGKLIRDSLIDNFFDNSNGSNAEKWLEVPDAFISQSASGQVALSVPDRAIPGRALFDQFMSEHFPDNMNASVEDMFDYLNLNGTPFNTTAHRIVSKLYASSAPRINASGLVDTAIHQYIMYPNSLKLSHGSGQQIAAALEQAAKNIDNSIQVYSSDDADGIMYYQMVVPFEMNQLNDLVKWEKNYEVRLQYSGSYLHGYSPDIASSFDHTSGTTYHEGTPWMDYPPISGLKKDPRLPDAVTGEVSREGKYWKKLEQLVQEAKKLGILYSVKHPDGTYDIKRVSCDNSVNWQFDISGCVTDGNGLLPMGHALLDVYLQQNGKTMDQVSATVELFGAGIMSHSHATEALAWDVALKTLRYHMPMMIEVRSTVERFRNVYKMTEKYNEEIMKRWRPARMAYLLKAQVLTSSEDGVWKYLQPDGKYKVIANLSKAMQSFLQGKDKAMVQNGMLCYYLYGKLEKVLAATKESFEDATERARSIVSGWMEEGDFDSLTAGETQFQALFAEREALAEKGAKLDGSDNASPKLCKAFHMLDAATLEAVDKFYFYLSMWEYLP